MSGDTNGEEPGEMTGETTGGTTGGTTGDRRPIGAIEGRIGRRLNNALTMTFRNGPEVPIGKAVQSGADGVGRKLGVLFGFKNGGIGVHVYTPAVAVALHVETRPEEPTLLTRPRRLAGWVARPDGRSVGNCSTTHSGTARPDSRCRCHALARRCSCSGR